MKSRNQLLLDRIKNWAASHENVVALIMTGSHARASGEIDEHSDLDLEIIADHYDKLANDSAWLKQFGKVMVSQSLTQDQGYPTRLVFYEGGPKVDFTLADTKRLADMIDCRKLDGLYDRGYSVIVDKSGVTKDLPKASGEFPVASPPTQAEFMAAIEEFWFEAAHIPGYLIRGELWVVKFRDWTMKELLLKMLEWRAVTASKARVDVWHIGSHMRDWVDPKTWEELQGVFSRFDAQESWRGFLDTVRLFRSLANETAEQAGLEYPHQVDKDVSQYIESFSGKLGSSHERSEHSFSSISPGRMLEGPS